METLTSYLFAFHRLFAIKSFAIVRTLFNQRHILGSLHIYIPRTIPWNELLNNESRWNLENVTNPLDKPNNRIEPGRLSNITEYSNELVEINFSGTCFSSRFGESSVPTQEDNKKLHSINFNNTIPQPIYSFNNGSHKDSLSLILHQVKWNLIYHRH